MHFNITVNFYCQFHVAILASFLNLYFTIPFKTYWHKIKHLLGFKVVFLALNQSTTWLRPCKYQYPFSVTFIDVSLDCRPPIVISRVLWGNKIFGTCRHCWYTAGQNCTWAICIALPAGFCCHKYKLVAIAIERKWLRFVHRDKREGKGETRRVYGTHYFQPRATCSLLSDLGLLIWKSTV